MYVHNSKFTVTVWFRVNQRHRLCYSVEGNEANSKKQTKPSDRALADRKLFKLTDPNNYSPDAWKCLSTNVVLNTRSRPRNYQNFQMLPSACHSGRTDIGRCYAFFKKYSPPGGRLWFVTLALYNIRLGHFAQKDHV
jgi:hypothetical protein